MQVAVGGFGGVGSDGNTVTVINSGTIRTYGSAASGILAQSIGGGGGNGGQAIMGLTGMFQGANYVDIGVTLATLPIGTTGTAQGIGKITVGGFGGAAANGGTVNVTNNAAIMTGGTPFFGIVTGDSAYGIEAQSIGGGGGNGGNAASGVTGLASIGGFGAASGKGGDVTVTNNVGGDITTFGTVVRRHPRAVDRRRRRQRRHGRRPAGARRLRRRVGRRRHGHRDQRTRTIGTIGRRRDRHPRAVDRRRRRQRRRHRAFRHRRRRPRRRPGIDRRRRRGHRDQHSSRRRSSTMGKGADGIEAQSIGGGGGNGGGSTLGRCGHRRRPRRQLRQGRLRAGVQRRP